VESLVEWLPKIGAGITFLVGLIGFFKPRLMLDPLNIALQSPLAISEARGVFGGLNLGMAIAAFSLNEPVIFTAMGIAWATVTLARFWSMAVDGIGFKASIPPLIVDSTICLLLLSPLVLN
jgi:hypothetical protein